MQSEFELGGNRLEDHPTVSKELRDECRSPLSGLAHWYKNSSCDKNGFLLDREHLAALRDLRRNEDIVILIRDKGNGGVILDKDDYVEKIDHILSQTDKFKCFGDVETNDNAILRERALQAFLLRNRKAGFISQEVYDRIRPVGCSPSRMYGLP